MTPTKESETRLILSIRRRINNLPERRVQEAAARPPLWTPEGAREIERKMRPRLHTPKNAHAFSKNRLARGSENERVLSSRLPAIPCLSKNNNNFPLFPSNKQPVRKPPTAPQFLQVKNQEKSHSSRKFFLAGGQTLCYVFLLCRTDTNHCCKIGLHFVCNPCPTYLMVGHAQAALRPRFAWPFVVCSANVQKS